MFRPPWRHVSLARKITILFGTAVLLIIAVTLVFPWLQMTGLNEQTLLLRAKRSATVAFQAVDLGGEDWKGLNERLRVRWPALAQDLGLDLVVPHVVRCDGAESPFQRDAVRRLNDNPEQRYYWRMENKGRTFCFAMAVRSGPLSYHPQALRGIIDVSIEVPRTSGVWNWSAAVLAGASGCVLAILVFYMLSQRLVLSPVQRLREAALEVTIGKTRTRAVVHTGDEFEALADAFNEMLDHLKAAEDEQRKINRSLDIRLGELAETNVALYESNRLKGEFLGNVTHELRTPLVSIIGFAELLRDAAQGDDIDRQRLARYSQNILTSGRSLLEIINDLLDLTKIEAGKMELHLSEFSIAELCHDLADFVRPLADKRNLRLECVVPEDAPTFHSDSGRIKQILYNLMSNAIKFTPEGGSIRLLLEKNGTDRADIVVSDTGPGIAPEQHQSIFEKFHQVDSSRTREHQGTGLGLAITKELVQMLGGTIRLVSVPGEGATFIVTLPTRVQKAVGRAPLRLS